MERSSPSSDVLTQLPSEDYNPETKKRTRPFMSRFERARVISLRAEQISRGASPLIDVREGDDPLATAERELRYGKIPFIIRRYLPNGGHEDWKINELKSTDRSDAL